MFNVEKTYGKNVHLYGFNWGDLNTTDNRGTFKGSIRNTNFWEYYITIVSLGKLTIIYT